MHDGADGGDCWRPGETGAGRGCCSLALFALGLQLGRRLPAAAAGCRPVCLGGRPLGSQLAAVGARSGFHAELACGFLVRVGYVSDRAAMLF